MKAQDYDGAAALLAGALNSRRCLARLPEGLRPSSIDDAYEIQRRVVPLYGGAPVGWKIGATSARAMERFKLSDPVFGRLIEGKVHESGALLKADAIFTRGAEVEFAFRMKADLPAAGAPYSEEAVVAAVAGLFPAIEVVASRYEDWLSLPPAEFIADNATHGEFVGGALVEDWSPSALPQHEVTIALNGVEQGRDTGSRVFGSPLNALVWLANYAAERGMGLMGGEIVTTGTTCVVVQVAPGDTVVGDFGSFGTVSASFA
jgi:2-keto-4-pentenoate hydratase